MAVTLLGKMIEAKATQFLNAETPMLVTVVKDDKSKVTISLPPVNT